METAATVFPAGRRNLPKPGLLALLFCMAVALGFDNGSGALAESWYKLLQPATDGQAASTLSQEERQQIFSRPPQEQAERLMRAAIHQRQGALELINSHVAQWRGEVKHTPAWSDLDLEARNSDDLQVRAAAIEIDLLSFNLGKDAVTAGVLYAAGEGNPALRAGNSFALGMLANRGVEPQQIRVWLLGWAQDLDENTRLWAVEGLAQIGAAETVNDLVRIFRSDPSLRVRERAACNLARAGMLKPEQRMGAVPQLIEVAADVGQDSSTRRWAFRALRQITGQSLPNQGASWRDWYARSGATNLGQARTPSPLPGGN